MCPGAPRRWHKASRKEGLFETVGQPFETFATWSCLLRCSRVFCLRTRLWAVGHVVWMCLLLNFTCLINDGGSNLNGGKSWLSGWLLRASEWAAFGINSNFHSDTGKMSGSNDNNKYSKEIFKNSNNYLLFCVYCLVYVSFFSSLYTFCIGQ